MTTDRAPASIPQILARLAGRAPAGLGCVVHVGAGTSLVADYAGLPFSHLVAIEGDPETAADLQAQLGRQSARPITVVARPVAASAGAMLWHRYNLRSLNGPLDASGLVRYFPRLSLTSTLPTQAIGLGDCLAEMPLSSDPARPNVLVLDVPGQEDALLAGLAPSTLRAFDRVVLRGCAQAPGAAWCAASAAPVRLEHLQFVREDLGPADDGFWPVSLLCFDRAAYERQAMEAQRAEAEARAQALQQHIQDLTQAKAAAEQLAAERATHFLTLTRARDEQGRLAAERLKQIQDLTQAKAASDKIAADRAAHFENLTKARDQQTHLAAERLKQIQDLAQAKAASDKIAAERAAHFENLTKARDEQTRLAAERLKRVGELEKRVQQLESELADSAVRQQLLQDELIRAEGQIDLIKDLLLRDHAL